MKKSKRQQRLAEEREQQAHASEGRWLLFMELGLLSLAIIFYISDISRMGWSQILYRVSCS